MEEIITISALLNECILRIKKLESQLNIKKECPEAAFSKHSTIDNNDLNSDNIYYSTKIINFKDIKLSSVKKSKSKKEKLLLMPIAPIAPDNDSEIEEEVQKAAWELRAARKGKNIISYRISRVQFLKKLRETPCYNIAD